MTGLRLTQYPDPRLRLYGIPTDPDRLAGAFDMGRLMLGAMDEWDGLGLATNQVGLTDRLFVYDDREGHRGMLANPELIDNGGTLTASEGCLSLPGIRVPVTRAAYTWIRGDSPDGPVEFKATGMLARIVQHECDHLNGVLIYQGSRNGSYPNGGEE